MYLLEIKSASVDVNVPEIIPDKTADIENPNFGDNVTYTVTVTNGGNADAKAVVVRDVLGKDLKFVSATILIPLMKLPIPLHGLLM